MMTRRNFLEFLGRTSILSTAALSGCAFPNALSFVDGLPPSSEDQLKTIPGISWDLVIKTFDPISNRDFFGQDNDFMGFIPFSVNNPLEGYLWVNHEVYRPQFLSDWDPAKGKQKRSSEKLKNQRYQVGGSLLHLKKENNQWRVLQDSKHNRRYTGETLIPFSGGEKIKNSKFAKGTLGNCCGGVTPWGTFLSCEENYHHFYGETLYNKNTNRYEHKSSNHWLSWESSDPQPPEHFGWVNEINPLTGSIEKLIPLGRFAHEGATVTTAADGRAVVYMGDDAEAQFFYKFISSSPGSLQKGTLYVADLQMGVWKPLQMDRHPEFSKRFKNQTDLLVHTRDAAQILGATPLNRPEDCDIDPLTGDIYLSCTNSKKDIHGSILKFKEQDANPLSLQFTSEVFLKGGNESGFSCPDNLAFDRNGNLWMVSDMAEDKPGYETFGNNSLFFIPTRGKKAGHAIHIATGPIQAEFTGLFFAPDQETLFLGVQHPGSLSRGTDILSYTSHWPEGGYTTPKSAVITLSGPALKRLMSYKA